MPIKTLQDPSVEQPLLLKPAAHKLPTKNLQHPTSKYWRVERAALYTVLSALIIATIVGFSRMAYGLTGGVAKHGGSTALPGHKTWSHTITMRSDGDDSDADSQTCCEVAQTEFDCANAEWNEFCGGCEDECSESSDDDDDDDDRRRMQAGITDTSGDEVLLKKDDSSSSSDDESSSSSSASESDDEDEEATSSRGSGNSYASRFSSYLSSYNTDSDDKMAKLRKDAGVCCTINWEGGCVTDGWTMEMNCEG